MKMRSIPVAELVFDFGLYPRARIEPAHLAEMQAAKNAGAHFPPIVIDRKSKRIIDGVHRARLQQREDPKSRIECVENAYGNEGEMFLDAMRLNAWHGRPLNTFDRTHAIILAGKLGLDDEAVAAALSMTLERVGALRVERTATANGVTVALKRTIRHFAGRKLNEQQAEANLHLSGMYPIFYANQLLLLLENDLIDREDEKLHAALVRLTDKLTEVLAVN